jgi:hypothetical protein
VISLIARRKIERRIPELFFDRRKPPQTAANRRKPPQLQLLA